MNHTDVLESLTRFPRATPIGSHDAWLACPDEVVRAFVDDGFEEYRREIVRSRRDRRPLGGLWQGLRSPDGVVVSVIWITRDAARPAVVFVDVDEQASDDTPATTSSWWDEIDEAVVTCLDRERSLTPADIARHVGVSEDAVTSIVAMLAQEGKLRISLVTSTASRVGERTLRCPVHGDRATVQFIETHAGHPDRVTWCTVFTPPTAVDCMGGCLHADPATAECPVPV